MSLGDEQENKIIEKIEISDEELRSLTAAIKTRHGIDFTNYEPKSLKRGFGRVIAKYQLGSLLGLWSKVLKDSAFLKSCIDDLTVNLTELFRNPEIWIKFRDDLLEKKIYQPELNFWHAGCSTGEEIYTTAIVLKEKKMLFKTKTVATDLSQTALNVAIEGKYSRFLMEKYVKTFQKYFPLGSIQTFFEFKDEFAQIQPEYKKHVRFLRHNLVQDSPPGAQFDFIFCRNVMIYFDDKLKMNVLKTFYDSLKNDGYFIIGYYDMLPEESKSLFVTYDPETRVYRKVI